ncbi:MAG: hypothetical protein ACKO1I_06525 [Microcystis aeruginosa]
MADQTNDSDTACGASLQMLGPTNVTWKTAQGLSNVQNYVFVPLHLFLLHIDIVKQSPNTNLSEQHKTGVRTKTLQVSGHIIADTQKRCSWESDSIHTCFGPFGNLKTQHFGITFGVFLSGKKTCISIKLDHCPHTFVNFRCGKPSTT